MNKRILLIIMLCSLLLSGCWDSNEAGRMFYLFGIGVDYKDGEYKVYAQLIDFASIARSVQPPNPDIVQSVVGEANGKTVNEAFNNLYNSLDEELYWGHITYLVFSNDLLEQGKLNPVINAFIQFHDTRYQTWVFSTKESIRKIMLAKPVLNKAISLSKLAYPINSYKQHSFIEPLNLRKLIINMDEPSHQTNIPLVSLISNWETYKSDDTETLINGVSVVTPKNVLGELKNEQAQGLQWLSDETIRAGLSVDIADGQEDDEKNRISVVIEKMKAKVIPIISSSQVRFDIHLDMVALLSGYRGDISVAEIQKAVKKRVEQQIQTTYQESVKFDSDVYRLSEYLYRKHLKTWKKFERNGRIELTNDSLRNITAEVRVTSGRKSFKNTIEN
ncbi:Ger(x)C family spore germination protein [Rummeliibacillus sp. POC4]|uniref:Ger(x)C family spore germination protein n=1 Tax=Rummeliibacillus sp. POC4 TaxID=2305899 RepID=UPI000E66605B|nr:Ger(x)C family spore germination protein [Rummeliibacillus sp. POC4]RIJ67965.1 Ger(x)C family spore germination protein [Rummeliibacillus sp. POC4]